MNTHTIEFREVQIEVTGTYYAGSFGDWETPPECQDFEIEKITASDIDLTVMLEENMNEIKNLVIDKIYS
jgi:hypothetical protein